MYDCDHKHRWGVILGGGDGVRLRPLTRLLTGDDRPKQFCALVGEKTLLTQTRDRVACSVHPERTLFVLRKSHEPYYIAELTDVPPFRMVVQPSNRGTLPAILWSLIRLFQLDSQAVVAFFPSDHHIADEEMFTENVTTAFIGAETVSGVILLGAAATAPETEYGWIEPERTKTGSPLPRVKRFWEKPSRGVAQTLLDRGCLWNTFVMVGRVDAFLELIRSAAPRLYETFQTSVAHGETEPGTEAMAAVYDRMETADFSKRILSAGAEKLSVLSLGDIGWDDLGDPGRVSAMMSQAPERKPDFVRAADVASAAAMG